MNAALLSPAQLRLWLADQVAGRSAVYVIPFGLRLRGKMDTGRLCEALNDVVARHPMLSARISAGPVKPNQWIASPERFDVPLTDLGAVPAHTREERMRVVAEDEVQRPFDLSRDPPFRARLLRLDESDHVLVMPIHHIVCDGLSLRILARDLGRAYSALAAGQRLGPRAPGPSFLDHARNEWSAESEDLAGRHLAYWQDRLAGAPDTLTMPSDRTRPPHQSFAGVTAHTKLRLPLVNAVDRLARDARTTPFTIYSATFHAWLARYSGETDTVVGFPIDGRHSRNSRDMVGLFANVLVQRVDVADDPTGHALVARAHRDIGLAQKHDRLRLDNLLADGRTGRLDRHQVFQALIDYHGYSLPESLFSETLVAEPMLFDTATARFDLELSLRQRAGSSGLAVALKCNADLFEPETAARMASHYRHFLEAFSAAPHERISRLPLMTPRERSVVLAGASGPMMPPPPWKSLHDIIEESCRKNAARCAVRADGCDYNYQDLERRSAAIAYALQYRGVRPDSIVAICAPRGFDLVAAMLGILRSGGAFLALDPEYPAERLRFMIGDARSIVVLATRDLVPLVGERDELLVLDDVADPPSEDAHSGIGPGHQSAVTPDALAYVLYTSGSTGQPKAVGNSHRGVLNRLFWMQQAYGLAPDEAVLQKTPIGFDVSVWELLWPLMVGARLVMAPPGVHRDADALGALIVRERVSVVHFVPSMLRAFLENGGLADLHGVRLLVTSGEALSRDSCDQITAGCRASIQNLYGPTEAAIDVTAFDVREGTSGVFVPIGRPIANTQVYVLDSHMEPVPAGVIGEIYIGGIQVARGYLGRPALTAERFVPDPFGTSGARLYRTGDLARIRVDGLIEFVGRADDQIKINGNRVEPGEIEAALQSIEGVVQSAVCSEEIGHHRRLLAIVAARPGTTTSDLLRSALEHRIPAPMIPSEFVIVDAVPLLPNGKLDRGRLRERYLSHRPVSNPNRAEPRTQSERILAEAWQGVLGVPATDIDIDRSFFTMGGDSIRSIQLVANARRSGLHITVADVFRHPTIRALATRAGRLKEAEEGRDNVPIQVPILPPEGEEMLPLSRLLEGFVTASISRRDYRVYVTSIRVSGRFDEPRLRQAAADAMARHPYLRSSIVFDAAKAVAQRIHRHVDPLLVMTDWRRFGQAAQDRLLERWLNDERARAFDWSLPPLWRLSGHRLRDDLIVLTLAEPFLDGWSATLLLTELLTSYSSLLEDKCLPPSPLVGRVQSAFLRAERLALESPDSRQFWRLRMQAMPVTRIMRFKALGLDSHARQEVALPASLSQQLTAVADDIGLPIKSVLLAAHMRALAALSGQSVVGTAMMANARPETKDGADAVGLFLNAIPMRASFAGRTWRQLIRDVYASEAEALPYRTYPFSQMLEDAGADFPSDALFNFTHFHPYERLRGGHEIRIEDVRAFDQTYFPLTVQFRRDVSADTIRLALEFDQLEGNLKQSDIAACYRDMLLDLAARVDGACAWRSQNDQRVPRRSAEAGTCLHLAFERQVAAMPQAPALLSASANWSYEDLDRHVRALTARLESFGLGKGPRIAVCMPRSPHLVAATLAALRMGGEYVPIDPSLPPKRLAHLCELARCSVVLVTQATAHLFPERRCLRVDTMDVAGAWPTQPIACDPQAPAYVIFTSGSTGVPKAVVVSHRAVMNRLMWQWRNDPFEKNEVCCMRTPIGFVDSFSEMFAALLQGWPTFIVENPVPDPSSLVTALSQGGVTRVTLTPSILSELLRLPVDLATSLPRLRRWTISGEPFPLDLAHELLRRIPGAQITNLYGSTEVAADATWYRVTGTEEGSSVPIGRPIDGVRAIVLDSLGNIAAQGVEGELAIGGAAVGTCYLDDPVLTAERFVPDPWGEPGARLFLSGDLARVDESGTLYCLGRADRQIKIRGVRVQPAEVETALREQPGVCQAVIVLGSHATQDQQLIGYVELESTCSDRHAPEKLAKRLRDALHARLSAAAVPSVYCIVESWPRSPSGKLDVAELPHPVFGTSYAPPETLVERELAGLWKRCLGEQCVGRYDDFFNLGGHSMRAVVLCSLVSTRFGTELTIAEIFDRATLSEQAKLIEDRLLAQGMH